MRNSTYLKSSFLVILALALVAGFVYLYKNSNNSDASLQERTLGSINRIKQIDANWDAQVLKAWVGMQRDYDVLTTSVKDMHKSVEELNREMGPFMSSDAQTAMRELEKLEKEKSELTEKFKRRNSVLKNSLRYLPTVQSEIRILMLPNSDAKGKTSANNSEHDAIDQLVSTVLQYNLFPEERLAASVQLQNESVRLSLGSMPPALSEKVSNLVKHVDVILTERLSIAMMISKIDSMPILEQLDVMAAEVSKGGVTEATSNSRYSRYLQFYTAAMLAIFLLIVIAVTRKMANLQEKTAAI